MKQKWDKKAILSILFFVLGVAVVFLFAIGLIPDGTMVVILGILGFSGIGAMRNFVNSRGWKTWFSIVVGFAGIVAEVLGMMTPDQLALWLSAWGLLATSGLTHALVKEKGR